MAVVEQFDQLLRDGADLQHLTDYSLFVAGVDTDKEGDGERNPDAWRQVIDAALDVRKDPGPVVYQLLLYARP